MRRWLEEYKKKLIPREKLKEKVEEIRKSGQTIVTLNGSFDLMHAGHLHIIFEASQVADVLIVALNTDRSIQQYKSPHRPIVPLEYRLQMMAALEFVDFVTWFDETDPREILNIIKPNVHVNGPEWGENCIEAETVKKHGGKIHIIELVPGLSTSQILKKIETIQKVEKGT
jgi:rfaE bifunctional protein nucleotidyltransferase chain/domain